MKPCLITLLTCLVSLAAYAQQNSPVWDVVRRYFDSYKVENYRPYNRMAADSVRVDAEARTLCVYANEPFCSQLLDPQTVQRIYRGLQGVLPSPYNTYHLEIRGKSGARIEDLVPNLYRSGKVDATRFWGRTIYTGRPWVAQSSLPYQVTAGLQNRHLFIWPSHGRYYKEGVWKWQRPYLYCTTEDLLTQSFVYPYLLPMLQNAGAVVACPRERDYQTREVVVDNDNGGRQGRYTELRYADERWTGSADGQGYGAFSGLLHDGLNPFRQGTYRQINTCHRTDNLSAIEWTPQIPEAGRYAVYVSYATLPNSVSDARYTVYHRGGRTDFNVNQKMGGSTWVYLGTFAFDEGQTPGGKVVLTNRSEEQGVVTADAVRFGGGVGRTERGMETSALPSYLEAARYYAQWAGIPDTLVNTEQGQNDYKDDLRVRSNMLNYLGGGSLFMPDTTGKKVPFELALALHTDAGIRRGKGIYGSLAISTSWSGDSAFVYPSGLSRMASSDLARIALDNLTKDLSSTFKLSWTRREHWDRNYAETRMPEVPAAIIEMLSHQNFEDMKYAHDPTFKFAVARSLYRSVLRFVSHAHGVKKPVVQPLPPQAFAAELTSDGAHVRLSWKPTDDALDPTATPSGYVLYTALGDKDFDNGRPLGQVTECVIPLPKGQMTCFRITAVNAGGQSFPSEVLTAYNCGKRGAKTVLMVNAFDRVSGPARVQTPDSVGFLLDADPGVPYLSTTAFSGPQKVFDPAKAGIEGSTGLGFSGHDWQGREIAGNTFDYPVCHGRAISRAGDYSFCSVSRKAFDAASFSVKGYDVIDYIAGAEAVRPYNLRRYPVLTNASRNKLAEYLRKGGSLLMSGSYVASDNQKDKHDRAFLTDYLKCRYDGSSRIDSTGIVRGLNLDFDIYRTPNSRHYAAFDSDAILPADAHAFSAFAYGLGQGAGVAYPGKDYRSLTLSFPFECIRDAEVRAKAMRAILRFLAP